MPSLDNSLSASHVMTSRWQPLYENALIGGLSFLPVICVVAPRFAGPGPVLLALVLCVLHVMAFARGPSIPRNILFWALVFPALMGLSGLWGINPDQTLERTTRALPVFLAGAVLWSMGTALPALARVRFHRVFLYAVMIAGAFCAFELHTGARLYYWLNESISPDEKFNLSRLNRSVAVFIICAIPAFYCAQQLSASRRSRTLLMMALGVITILVLVGTKSQSVQLASVLAVIFYVAFPYRQRWAWFGLGAILAAGLLGTPWIAHYLFTHLADMTARISWLSSSYMPNRMEIWDFVTRRALEQPWLGHGVEATRDIKDFQTAKMYHNASEVLHPHNFAAQLWIEFGVLGALLGASFFAFILRGIARTALPGARTMLALLIACISIAATGYGLWQSWWLGLFVMALASLAVAMPPRASSDTPSEKPLSN